MLKSLSIKNLALIKSQDIEFSKGLNIILGETGAGKSLVFNALEFVLSLKTDKMLIRSGEQSMRVDAEFEPVSNLVHEILNEIEADDESLIISRTLQSDGRSTSRVNGVMCPQTTIKRLAEGLVDSFMQHENMEILKSKNHLSYLDKFCDISQEKIDLKEILDEIKQIKSKISSVGGSERERQSRRDYLEFQISEIEKADLKQGEEEEIEERLKILEASERITNELGEFVRLTDGNGGVLSNMLAGERQLSRLSDIDAVSELHERLTSARLEMEDILSSVKDVLADADADPIELERLSERRDKIRELKRKFGGSIEEVLNTLKTYKEEVDFLADSENMLQRFNGELLSLEKKAEDVCQKIHDKREKAAKVISEGLERQVLDLGMKNARFEVEFKKKEVSFDGFDDVKLIFSANKGEALKDLSKTASGGESSRIMLAMKNMFARENDEKTLLFDEIDAGISGEVGNMMAEKLKNISRFDQVLAITHLPQVAAAGDMFYKVEKTTRENATFSEIKEVKGGDIIKEIAHIIGGNNISETMLKNAKELYDRKHP